jgi:hypothetical protein
MSSTKDLKFNTKHASYKRPSANYKHGGIAKFSLCERLLEGSRSLYDRKIQHRDTTPSYISVIIHVPVTVSERSKACTVFARLEAGIMGSNPTQGMEVWCLCMYVRLSVFVYR